MENHSGHLKKLNLFFDTFVEFSSSKLKFFFNLFIIFFLISIISTSITFYEEISKIILNKEYNKMFLTFLGFLFLGLILFLGVLVAFLLKVFMKSKTKTHIIVDKILK